MHENPFTKRAMAKYDAKFVSLSFLYWSHSNHSILMKVLLIKEIVSVWKIHGVKIKTNFFFRSVRKCNDKLYFLYGSHHNDSLLLKVLFIKLRVLVWKSYGVKIWWKLLSVNNKTLSQNFFYNCRPNDLLLMQVLWITLRTFIWK